MSMLINDAVCDTFAYLDDKQTGETIIFDLSERTDYAIVVYLYADGVPFPVNQSLTVRCCATENRLDPSSTKTIIDNCTVGSHGEIIITIPSELRVSGKTYYCEISVVGTDADGNEFMYRSSNFRLSVIA